MGPIFSIKHLHELDVKNFDKMTEFYRDCFSGGITLENLKSINNGDVSFMSGVYGNTHIFMCLLQHKEKSVYVSDVCVKKNWRGKGIMKKAFDYITDYYGTKGHYYLTLTASNEMGQGLNQKKRIQIFNKHDFYITSNNVATGLPVSITLTNGKQVMIKSGPLKQEGLTSKYLVEDYDGNRYKIPMNIIESCFTNSWFGGEKVHCPMKKTLKKGGRRLTRNIKR